MLRIISHNLQKKSTLPENIRIPLNTTEQKIFDFIREAVPSITGNPTPRVAGGWIRDKFLGKPSKDIDITIEGMKGTEFANKLRDYAIQKYGPQQKIVGTIKDTEARPEQIKNLAVAFLRLFGEDIEILNLRGNEEYQEGDRNPVSTKFDATPEQDAYRRDLTINSLFYNILTGRVEDFTSRGYDDLGVQQPKSRYWNGEWRSIPPKITLRTPLDPIKTFKDDPLRLLRVLRFYSRYLRSSIAPEVIKAMADPGVQHMIVRKMHNPDDEMGIVTERTAEEFRKIMKGEQPEEAIRIMFNTGLLQQMLNLPINFHPLHMNQKSKYHDMSLIDHTIQVIKNTNNLSKEFELSDNERYMMNISSLFHDLGKLDPRSHKIQPDGTRGYSGDPSSPEGLTHQQSSSDIFESFANTIGLTNRETSFIQNLVLNHMNPHNHIEQGRQTTDRQLRRFRGKNPDMWKFQYIHAMADAMSKDIPSDPTATKPYRDNMARLEDPILFPQQLSGQDLLNGKEIIGIVGLPPQPPASKPGLKGYIEVVKDRIREEQYANPNLTKEEAISIVHQVVSGGELDIYRV